MPSTFLLEMYYSDIVKSPNGRMADVLKSRHLTIADTFAWNGKTCTNFHKKISKQWTKTVDICQ